MEPPVSEQPAAPAPGGGKKILGLNRTTFYLALAGAVVVGLAFYWWRNYQSAAQGIASGTGTSSGTGTGATDVSGQLSAIQTELEALQQAGAPATTSSGGGGGYSGGGWDSGQGWNSGSSTGGTGTSAGTDTGTSSGSGTQTGVNGAGSPPVTTGTGTTGSGTATTAKSSAPTGGHVVSVSNNRATVAWNANGATRWQVKITGPGPINGHTSTVTVPQAVYTGLSAGHTYTVQVTPLSPPGPSGNITLVTSK
ncbi:MAG TPA: hypothetical protein VMD31_07630 [Opitutaceae bacterium]|nr:hypothetical protein [Opitutaceae bacterium]